MTTTPFEMAAPDAAVCEDGVCAIPVVNSSLADDADTTTLTDPVTTTPATADQPQA